MIYKPIVTQIIVKNMSKRKIPDRWIPYKPCGDVIEGTRIICFKVPLQKKVQERVPGINQIWDIPTLLSKIPKLGAVIDLTNTARYYNPGDFAAANVTHKKILMPGREIPPPSKVKEFMDAVDEFLRKDSSALIGVHCTHGLNRTGYMVCRYMRDRLNVPAEEAITRFEKARGYKMERKVYTNDLLGVKGSHGKTDVEDPQELVEIERTDESVKNGFRERRYDTRYYCNSGHSNRNSTGYTRNATGYTRNKVNDDRSKSNENKYLSWRVRDGSSDNGHSSRTNYQNKQRSKPKKDKYSRPYSYAYDY